MTASDAPAATRARHDRQNLLVLAGQFAGWFMLLQLLHAEAAWPLAAALLVVFCLMMQGVFSMMHECFHGCGHRNPALNRAMGMAASTIFGTAYSLIRVNHEGHHRRNRSAAELAEFILPGERPALKIGLYYFAILGGIWLGSFVGTLLLPFVPYRHVKALAIRWISMDGYNRSFAEFTARDWRLLRLESALAVAWWIGCILLFDWDLRVLALAYACYAFSYSSLQWVYHVRTPLDRIEGAYDLRLPAPVRWLFLNFNYNLAHHRSPAAPWQALHAAVDPRETQPLWHRYLGVFRPPEPLPEDTSRYAKTYF